MSTVLRFAPEFVHPILAGSKRATTRLLREFEARETLDVGTTCAAVRTDTGQTFATLMIINAETRLFADLDDRIASIENHQRAEDLKRSLRRFYPSIQPHDTVRILHFQQVENFQSTCSSTQRSKCVEMFTLQLYNVKSTSVCYTHDYQAS